MKETGGKLKDYTFCRWNSQRGKKLHRFLSLSTFALSENKNFQSFNHQFENVSLNLH